MARNSRPPGQPYTSRKTVDRAIILPLVGLMLLVPPIARIFQIDALVFGIPFTALYLFGVWALLILGAASLSRSLTAEPDDDTRPPDQEP